MDNQYVTEMTANYGDKLPTWAIAAFNPTAAVVSSTEIGTNSPNPHALAFIGLTTATVSDMLGKVPAGATFRL